MQEFFASAWGAVVSLSGGVAVLWGLSKACGALRLWLTKRWTAHRERLAIPQKTLTMLEAIKRESEDMDALQASQLAALSSDVASVKERLDRNADQTATLQNEKLNWAYVYYGKQQHPIPMQTRNSLEKMYKQYKDDLPPDKERNHVPTDWLEVIYTAPIAEA